MKLSIIVPVYFREEELIELLDSAVNQTNKYFEVIIVDDGSNPPLNKAVEKYMDLLEVKYFFKNNTGPGDSRNYGVNQATGNWIILVDSDCILPNTYVQSIYDFIQKNPSILCFGGADAALDSFSDIQKAINFTMTSFVTTGGVRGSKKAISKFQPRSFNMGIEKEAFLKVGGFGNIHPGEDPELTFKLWDNGIETAFASEVKVYHKRRISWSKFRTQVYKFALTRNILNVRFPQYSKPTFWIPSLFCFSLITILLCSFVGFLLPLYALLIYMLVIVSSALYSTKSWRVTILVLPTFFIQMLTYGIGYLEGFFKIKILKRNPEQTFPNLFF